MSGNLRNAQDEAKELYPRLKILYITLIVSSLVIFGRLWHLQIIQGQELRAYSENNRIKKMKVPAPRGHILDREGRKLVENQLVTQAVIYPQYSKNLEETASALSEILLLSPEQIINLVKTSRYKNGPFRPVVLKENLNSDERARIDRLMFFHPGLHVKPSILRTYPLNENGAQLFGYVGEISKRQISKYNKKYKPLTFEQGDIIGKSGLEEIWEKSIRGKDGLTVVEVDARGRSRTTSEDKSKFLGIKRVDEQSGHNLVLTIDKDIQEAAYKAMQREDHIGPRIGGLVAIKNNGEILAWVNAPSFNPNDFSYGISNDLWTKLLNDPFKPLRNKIIQDHYAPGSTFKPIVALAAIQEKKITKNTIIYSPGTFRYGRRTYHDHLRGGHGNITVFDALERSSNVFFYKMGVELGIDAIAKYATLLGLGAKTGISLPNEVSGKIPTKKWKLDKFSEAWQPGENLSNAIGQGFVLSNALQMAIAYNAIGLEGSLYKPRIVKRILNSNNELIKEFEPELLRDVSIEQEGQPFISKETFKIVKEGLRRVGNGERGTAKWWKIPGIEIAGKTGTSQVRSFSSDEIYKKCENRPIKQRHHGSFIGYAPSEHPEITVAFLAEHSCHGSTGAAPIVRDVILAYMEKYHPELIKVKKKKIAKTKNKKTETN